jgi:hypothetical protein
LTIHMERALTTSEIIAFHNYPLDAQYFAVTRFLMLARYKNRIFEYASPTNLNIRGSIVGKYDGQFISDNDAARAREIIRGYEAQRHIDKVLRDARLSAPDTPPGTDTSGE